MQLPLPDYLQRLKDLYWAMRTRVLTDEELTEVEKIGWGITIDYISYTDGRASSIPYKELEKIQEFNNALLNQFKMRIFKEQAEKGILK